MEKSLTTIINAHHHNLGEGFIKRVQDILQSGQPSIISYAVDSQSYADMEIIKLKINENTTLEMTFRHSK